MIILLLIRGQSHLTINIRFSSSYISHCHWFWHEIKDQYPEIPWKNISGFRNIIVYDYLGLDLNMIWSVVELELPKLDKGLILMEKSS